MLNEESRQLRLETSAVTDFMNSMGLALARRPKLIGEISHATEFSHSSRCAKFGKISERRFKVARI